MNHFLLEIGTEEIPAGYIVPALNALKSSLVKKLDKARIDHGTAEIFGTPRRLAIIIADVEDRQKSMTTELIGPPAKIGFDENGQPTVAGKKFAEKAGIPIDKIEIKETKKGSYLAAIVNDPGRESIAVLADILPDTITGIPFPKTMKWADFGIRFARPIHTVIALLGDTVVSFVLENIKSSNKTSGHRFMHPEPVVVLSAADYKETLRKAHVIVDIAERREEVEKEVVRAAESLGGRILPDEALLDEVTNLVETPIAVGGRFDENFLQVPDEVLITAMREHQKYFAVVDEKEKLMPCFIAVNNTRAKDLDLVATGHERVLRARLSDADFFFKCDLEVSVEKRIEQLKKVLFQANLGSVYDKAMRMQKLSGFIAKAAEVDHTTLDYLLKAALICKSDLVSNVVVEFPKLQGIIGRVYAFLDGEPEEVALAVEEHYRPAYSGGALPETVTGALLSISDKLDSICGCFSLDLIPTGASDPYALRRQGIGIIQIMRDRDISFSLKSAIEHSAGMFFEKDDDRKIRRTADTVYTFLQRRITHILEEQGLSKDVIASVTEVGIDNIPDVWNRARALEDLKSKPDFEPLAVSFKRVVNIIRKSGYLIAGNVDEALFKHESESALFKELKNVKTKVDDHLENARFDKALLEIASLRGHVDAFFDGVMVMDKDEKIRDNRLLLLNDIANMFGQIADFTKILT
ncbi:glycine--tRNA ligase subunit beta [Desulfobacterales bacterium HSG16]|nr:glycine--tRNA ligase subunit beta [Desulfobacterales bacterium HSG16]